LEEAQLRPLRQQVKGEIVMADANTERRADERERSLERRSQGGGLLRRGEFGFPSFFARPDDLFTMNPFTLMRRLTEDMDRMFYGRPGAGVAETGRELSAWAPPIEVREENGALVVSTEIPGVDQNDVKVEVRDDSLVIRGERKREWAEEKQGIHRSERYYGSFYREVPLPEGAKVDAAKAEFRNGVLEVRLPVPESRKTREIPIQSGGERKSVGVETSKPATQTSKAG
jgi:HSP20 family protein